LRRFNRSNGITHVLEPAASIIERLGGPQVVARHLGIHPTRVTAWRRPRGSSSGTGGMVPHWRIPALLELARQQGVPMSELDFAPVLNQAPSERAS
jgi:hypothetical protein